jgi:hypothetical protein
MIRVRSGEGKANPVEQEVFWSWSADGRWLTPNYPRLTFASYPILYKLYVVRTLGDDEKGGSEASVAFLQLLLPEVERCVTSRG